MMTRDLLRSLLQYDSITGHFVWLKQVSNRIKIGDIAGNLDKDGYLLIQVCGTKYRAGRLAFLYMNGRWPTHEVDHVDGNRANDAWTNLREVTRSDNVVNSDRATGASGLRGVKFDPKTSTWRARIEYKGHREYVGVYATKEEAYQAYLTVANQVHGEFALHNRPNPIGAK